MTTITVDRAVLEQALAALEIGHDSAQAEAAQYHAAMAGYRPERHAAMDADVEKIAQAIIALRAALTQPEQEPVVWTDRELQLIDGMIEVQLHHAAQCDGIANRPMAERQKGWDMKRVALLQKIKSISPRREPEQEPVAWMLTDDSGMRFVSVDRPHPDFVPLYTTPPRREWQSLSEEEINELSHTMVKGHKSVNWLARAIEAKLKEKNNG